MTEVLEAHTETATALTVQDRAALALNTTKTERHLKALASKNAGIKQILNKDGRTQAHGAAMELRAARVEIANIAKAARDDATKFSKAVIAEENRLIAIIAPEETRLLAIRDAWDADQERIKRENEERERVRIEGLTARIDQIRGYVQLAMECRTSDMVKSLQDKLTAIAVDDSFEEYEAEAAIVKEEAMKRVTGLHAAKLADEQERARTKAEQEAQAEALRKEREELAAAQAEAKRAADAAAATVKAAAEEMAAQRAAFEAEQEKARQALVAEARKIAEERAALEAEKTAPAQETKQPAAPVECAQVAAEIVAKSVGIAELLEAEPLVLHGQPLSIAIDPTSPPVTALVQAVADTFSVSLNTAADWLTNAADDIANFQE